MSWALGLRTHLSRLSLQSMLKENAMAPLQADSQKISSPWVVAAVLLAMFYTKLYTKLNAVVYTQQYQRPLRNIHGKQKHQQWHHKQKEHLKGRPSQGREPSQNSCVVEGPHVASCQPHLHLRANLQHLSLRTVRTLGRKHVRWRLCASSGTNRHNNGPVVPMVGSDSMTPNNYFG